MRYLILGCGPAGIAAAKAVRNKDLGGEIVMATEEVSPFYLRPLLPDLLAGRADVSGIADPQAETLAENKIAVRRGAVAQRVDAARKKVAFADGTEEAYDVLLVATGGKPEIPPALSKPFGGILPFDSLEDSLRILSRTSPADTVVVYGPGFLAITASAGLKKRVGQVVWFKPDTPKCGYPIGGELEANILDSVRNTGVRILDGHDIAAVRETPGGGMEVDSSEGGETIRCAAVVVATERRPATGFLAGSGVKIETGIVVDETFRTSVPGIYAAGDCAELFDKESRQSRINFGWRSAIRQGRLAGENMAGGQKKFVGETSDYFWVLFGPALLDRIK